jgi:hypothetical protein
MSEAAVAGRTAVLAGTGGGAALVEGADCARAEGATVKRSIAPAIFNADFMGDLPFSPRDSSTPLTKLRSAKDGE